MDQLPNFVVHGDHSAFPDQQMPPPGESCSTDGPSSSQPSVKRRLNPIFVEALMRWPIGWTDFGCSETGLIPWLRDMRGFVWMLVTVRAESESGQGSLFG